MRLFLSIDREEVQERKKKLLFFCCFGRGVGGVVVMVMRRTSRRRVSRQTKKGQVEEVVDHSSRCWMRRESEDFGWLFAHRHDKHKEFKLVHSIAKEKENNSDLISRLRLFVPIQIEMLRNKPTRKTIRWKGPSDFQSTASLVVSIYRFFYCFVGRQIDKQSVTLVTIINDKSGGLRRRACKLAATRNSYELQFTTQSFYSKWEPSC